MHDNDFIFILEDHNITSANIPYIMKDLLQVCRIRRLNLIKLSRIFIKVNLSLKNIKEGSKSLP